MEYRLRDFRSADANAVNQIALKAFEQYQDYYQDWKTFSRGISHMSALSQSAELIIAEVDGQIAGAVAYVGPGKEKASFFPAEWPIVRMLVVQPGYRGMGIGRALTQECIRRAVRDGASLIALHTSPIMKVALPMYERMGFQHEREAPPVHGVSYGIYVKQLETTSDTVV